MLHFSILEWHKCVYIYIYIYIYMRLIGPGISQVSSLPQQRQLTKQPTKWYSTTQADPRRCVFIVTAASGYAFDHSVLLSAWLQYNFEAGDSTTVPAGRRNLQLNVAQKPQWWPHKATVHKGFWSITGVRWEWGLFWINQSFNPRPSTWKDTTEHVRSRGPTWCHEIRTYQSWAGACGGAVGWGTALQGERSRVLFTGIYHWLKPSDRTTAVGPTHLQT